MRLKEIVKENIDAEILKNTAQGYYAVMNNDIEKISTNTYDQYLENLSAYPDLVLYRIDSFGNNLLRNIRVDDKDHTHYIELKQSKGKWVIVRHDIDQQQSQRLLK